MPRRHKADALPPAIKAELERMLIDRTHAGYKALSAWLAERGFYIGKSSIHRYDARLQEIVGRIRASAEAACVIARQVPDDADEHSAAVLRLVQSELFDVLLNIGESEAETDPAERIRMLAQAARAAAEASRASIGHRRWQDAVRAKVEAAEQAVARAGRSLDEIIQMIRGAYGV